MVAKFSILALLTALLLSPGFLNAAVCDACDFGSQCGSGLHCRGGDPSTSELEGVCQYDDPGRIAVCNPLQADSFVELLDNVLNFIFNIAVWITPIMVMIAGFFFVTAAGNPERITKARNILIWTAIGFAVILLSRGFTAVLSQILGG